MYILERKPPTVPFVRYREYCFFFFFTYNSLAGVA